MANRKPPLPTKEQIVAFIRESASRVGKREIARAFHIKGAGRIALKALLKELRADGVLARDEDRRLGLANALPEYATLAVIRIDGDGEILGQPVEWTGDVAPEIVIETGRTSSHAPAVGDRILARIRDPEAAAPIGVLIRTLGRAERKVVGYFERLADGGGRVRPADRRNKSDYTVAAREASGAGTGDVVLIQPHAAPRFGPTRAKVVARIGHEDDAGVISLIAAHAHGLPIDFPRDAEADAVASRPAPLGDRADLRAAPFVTIDGEDARDFDDAVFAAAEQDGGWRLAVAIADVSWYVRPGSPLDRAALERGTSVYFPDRVVPMLPEALSNELCSLKPGQDRACLVAHLWIDRGGRLRKHRFERALIRSIARLTYEQVQTAHDGQADGMTRPLLDDVIAPLYGAYKALDAARRQRGTLELDVPERMVEMGPDKRIRRIGPRRRLDSHKLIEEFMIAANVAAAQTLEARTTPCMYRIHDAPDPLKISALADVVAGIGLSFAKGQSVRPAQFNRLLERARGTPDWELINDMVLRTQAQARYAPQNIGHYGLGLARYCHFTSPIRRYADVLVHRALVRSHGLGEGGLSDDQEARFDTLGDMISDHERRGVAAERDALDRYVAVFLADKTGAIFDGRVTGVTRAGLFVTLVDTGASGLVPMSFLPRDFYHHDIRRQRLTGRDTGQEFRLGQRVRAYLVEAEPVTGSLVFRLLAEGEEQGPQRKGKSASPRSSTAARPARRHPRPGRRGDQKGPPRRH